MTEEEARDRIIEAARDAADWWINHATHVPCEDRITGVLHSFLSELDGVGSGPPVDFVVLDSDPETGETIGETRVSTMLHEYLYVGWRNRTPNTD